MKIAIFKTTGAGAEKKRAEGPVDHMAVVVDKEKRKADVLDIDCVEIVAILFNRKAGILDVQLEIGAKDAEGKFHSAPQYPPAKWSLYRDMHEKWKDNGLDTIEIIDLDQVRNWIHADKGVKRIGESMWGIKDLESEVV